MSTKRQIGESSGIYFITITCYEWMPLFQLIIGYDIVYKWFDYLKQLGHYVTGYVIMPNHLHVLIAFRQSAKSINTVIGNGKRFMAYEIVKRLESAGEENILTKLKEGISVRDHKRGQLHAVFQSSFDWKECRSNRFINQKLNYMHDNPCRGKWNLCASPIDYVHSSARFYLTGEQSVYQVFHCGLLDDDIDLTQATV